jgi:hypothetical protein
MKNIMHKTIGALVLTAALVTAHTAFAQTKTVESTTTSTVTSAGTISEFGPEMILLKSESSPDPIRYSYSKTTTYVDEAGAPVSIETVKSGVPVTVYYTKVGNRLLVSKVMVTKSPVVPPPVVEKKTTTTTETQE